MSTTRGARDWMLLLGLALVWGTAFAFTRQALTELSPSELVAGRLTVGALALGGYALVAGPGLPRGASLWGRITLLAIFSNALPFLLISWGQTRVDSGLAGTLLAVMPLTTLVLAHFFVAGDRMNTPKTLGFGLGFGGILVLTGGEALGAMGGADSDLLHQLAVVCGAVSYAVSAILARRMPPNDPVSLAGGTMLMAAAIMVPTTLLLDGAPPTHIPAAALAAVLWLGLMSTAAGMLMYFMLIESAGPTFFSMINFILPPVALLVGWLAFDEQPGPSVFVALAMLLAGLLLGQRRTSQ